MNKLAVIAQSQSVSASCRKKLYLFDDAFGDINVCIEYIQRGVLASRDNNRTCLSSLPVTQLIFARTGWEGEIQMLQQLQ